MKVLQLVSLATLGLCGFVDNIEDIVLGNIDKLEQKLSGSSDSAAELLLSMQKSAGDALGSIPPSALDAWRSVLADVPNGAAKLKSDIEKLAARKNSKPAGRKIDMSRYDYHVTDERFPEHSLRVANPSVLGVDKVKQYSGYLDVEDEDKHFFFWFFESRNKPKDAPVVLWLNGGPGCSSLTGLFFELGPASINQKLEPVHNKYSWNENANVIFLDQPVNVGYSYSSGSVSDTVTAGKDTFAFLELFFKQFPEYAENDFHIAGESYGGHYIPVFASEILSHEDRHFNLTSALIGNGLTDPLRQYDAYEPMACGDGGAPPVVGPEECQGMLDSQPRCNKLIDSCYESQSAWTCVPATIYCNNVAMGPYQKTGRNVYDVREDCQGDNGLCYPQLDFIDKYLNQEFVKQAVGADDVETYQGCNMDINSNFLFKGDWMMPYYTAVSELLEQGIPVLIYAGDKDFICNWLGNEIWSRQLPWSGHKKFAKTELSPWVLKDGDEAGQVRNYEHFTFLRVYEAGHMVPFNQPKSSLEMLDRWISGDYTFA